MRFSLVHKLVSYLLALAGFAALALSGELSRVTLVLGLLAFPLSWFWEGAERLQRAVRFWQVATIAFIVYFAIAAARGLPPLGLGIDLLVYMQVNRLFNRRTSKDYLQLYVLAFLELVAGATLNSGVSYGLTFAAFVVFATWSMTLLHLRRETEENYLLKHTEDAQSEKVEVERILSSRRIIGGQFLLGTSLVSLGVFGGSLLVFLLFPRIGVGILGGAGRPGINTTGFSERVTLDGFGVLRDNPTVVMRVEVDGFAGNPPTLGIRWRGVAFERYDGHSWSRAPQRTFRRKVSSWPTGKVFLDSWHRGRAPRHPLRATVYLEPLDTDVLFVPGRPVELDFGKPPVPTAAKFVERGVDDDLHLSRGTALRYRVVGDLLPQPPQRRPRPRELQPYLALPARLSPKVVELTRRVIRERVPAGRETPRAKAEAILKFLTTSYRYTTVLHARPPEDPLADFLLNRKEGHCEYFSTAMAIMLRIVGVPTRNVSGFAGGQWNPVGRYYAIRSGDAHSWVEAYIAGEGWVTFDPTPSAGSRPLARAEGSLSHLLDAMRLRWLKWVIEYDLGRQVGAIRRVERWWRMRRAAPRRWHRPSLVYAIPVGLFALALAGNLLWRRRRGAGGAPGGPSLDEARARATRLYLRLLAALARHGHPKPPHQTAREFALSLQAAGAPAAERVVEATRLYERARFGGDPPGSEERLRIEERLREVAREIGRELGQRSC